MSETEGSKRTMAYRRAEPLYGAPRGNRVLAAKRVTGPSAKVLLETKVALEKCSVKGCKSRVLVTKNPTGETYTRHCVDHVGIVQETTPFSVRDALDLGAWQARG